jgi:hypothetical protein
LADFISKPAILRIEGKKGKGRHRGDLFSLERTPDPGSPITHAGQYLCSFESHTYPQPQPNPIDPHRPCCRACQHQSTPMISNGCKIRPRRKNTISQTIASKHVQVVRTPGRRPEAARAEAFRFDFRERDRTFSARSVPSRCERQPISNEIQTRNPSRIKWIRPDPVVELVNISQPQ